MAKQARNPLRIKIESHATGKRFIEATAADMRNIYASVRAQMMARLAELATAGKEPIPFSAKHVSKLIEAVTGEYAGLESEMRATMKRALPYVAESYHVMALANTRTSILGKFSTQRVDEMLKDTFSHIAGATRAMKDADIRHLRNVAAKVFRESSITGDTRREVSRRLMGEALSVPNFGFVDRAGRRWDNGQYFDMLGRTVLQNSGRTAYIDTCAGKGKDVVVVSTSGNPCPRCQVWERRLLSLTGSTPGMPTLQQAIDRGLFHPNCTHSITAVPNYSRERKYEANGRPKAGLNSEGQELRDNKKAWREYRKGPAAD